MLSKLLSPRTVGLAIAIVIGAATAAAAVTVPPGDRPSFAGPHATTTTTSTTVAKSSVTTTATTEKPEAEKPETETDDNSQGTPASVTDPHAQFGLCNAWLHNSDEAKANSDVFKALAAAHGGAAGTTTYCQGIVKNKKSGHGHGDDAGTHGKPSTSSGGDGSQSD